MERLITAHSFYVKITSYYKEEGITISFLPERRFKMDLITMYENVMEQMGQELDQEAKVNALETAIDNYDAAWERYYATKLY